MSVDKSKLELLCKEFLICIGENPDDPRISDTPKRWAKMWAEFIDYDAGNITTSFKLENMDQMIVVRDIKIWSICEHHLVPFWANITLGYIPKEKVLGLSKFGRIAHKHAHKLQIQERLVADIAKDIMDMGNTDSVAVIAQGEHLCMTMRGIKTPAIMVSSSMNGVFRNNGEARSEFLRLAKLN